MKKLLILIVVVLFIASIIFWRHNQQQSTPPPQITIGRGNINIKATAIGNIVPKHVVTVKSTLGTAGTVLRLYHQPGDYVKAGEPLLQLSPNPDPETDSKTLAALHQDEASLSFDREKLKQYDMLLKKKLIPPTYEDYLTTKEELQKDLADETTQQQQLELLQKGSAQIGKQHIQSIVKSPINGFVLARLVDVGDPVSPMGAMDAGTQLFTIADMKHLIFKGSVSEIDAGQITLGMPAKISIGAFAEHRIPGEITQLALESAAEQAAQSSNPSTATDNNQTAFSVGYPIEISNLNIPSQIKLRSGLSATADINIKTLKNVLVIPESAILFKNSKAYAKVWKGSGKTQLVEIKLGVSDGLSAEIKSGIAEGTQIIANPQPLVDPDNNS